MHLTYLERKKENRTHGPLHIQLLLLLFWKPPHDGTRRMNLHHLLLLFIFMG